MVRGVINVSSCVFLFCKQDFQILLKNIILKCLLFCGRKGRKTSGKFLTAPNICRRRNFALQQLFVLTSHHFFSHLSPSHIMNHLAHCFLSFDNEDLLVGNFIGDFVKGSAWKNYPAGVQRGILLHRAIDSFTDNHEMTQRSKERIRPFAGRYAAPVVDVLYDHLLAIHWEKYTDEPFDVFTEKVYARLEKRAAEMPEELQERLPRMLTGKFLHGYQTREGMEWVLNRFSRRMVGGMDAAGLSDFFFSEIEVFSEDFNGFFPELIAEASAKK